MASRYTDVCLYILLITHELSTSSKTTKREYRQTSNVRRSSVGNKDADHSDVVGASHVGVGPTTSSILTKHLVSVDWDKTTVRQDENHLSYGMRCV